MAKLCRDVIATGDNVFRPRPPTVSSQGTPGSSWLDGLNSNDGRQNGSDIEEVIINKVCFYLSLGRIPLTLFLYAAARDSCASEVSVS